MYVAQIPLALKLRKKAHRDIAAAQDIIVKELYGVFDRAVLHGGTAIWRCYGSSRFSEDVDFYFQRDEKKLGTLFRKLEEKGFVINKRRVREKSLFSVLEFNGAIVRFEAVFKVPLPKGILAYYETSDGNLMAIYTLSPEELVREKVAAYLGRRKVRDLYDIFSLLRHVKDTGVVSGHLRRLVEGFKDPVDGAELAVLIIEGIVPEAGDMLSYIRRKA